VVHGTQLMWGERPWMKAPEVSQLFTTLGAPDVDARFVGGCVRDAVLDRDIGDIDVATPEVPEKVMRRLAAADIKAVPTGLDHGTLTAIVNGTPFEVTSLRRDTACDGRHADVEFTTDWHEDSRRRDFTMNAMSLRPDGTLFDDHGGFEDAKTGRLRFVGSPTDRIREDYLRVLRLFRFFAWYGQVPLDEATLVACQTSATGLGSLSAERVQQEISKLLSAPNPGPAVNAMHERSVLSAIFPDVNDVSALPVLLSLEKEAIAFPPGWLRRLAILIPGSASVSIAERLKLSNADRNRLRALTNNEFAVSKDIDGVGFKRLLYKFGADFVIDRVLMAWARDESRGEGDTAQWRALTKTANAWTPRRLPINGDDILALGVSSGPEVGRCLAEIEGFWIDGDFNVPREELLKELRRRTKDLQ
jgi:poly(A) polymerase